MKTMHLEIAEGLSVAVIPNPTYEFMLSTDDVSKGYGVSPNTIREHKRRNQDEFKEGVHFLTSTNKSGSRGNRTQNANLETKQIFWTKAGIIRLGFFVKSHQAKMFRNWAEKVILKEMSKPQPDVTMALHPARFKAESNHELGLIFQNLMYRQLMNVENTRTRKRMAALLDFYVSQIE